MITIASVPTAHRYVAHLETGELDTGNSGVFRLPDPVPSGARTNDPWWPPRWLDPEWLRGHTDRFDLLHLHFGFDALPVEQLEALVHVLRADEKPLVFTVHDLHNPHFADNTLHERQLDVLVPAADELITLTTGAAAEIRTRWGVDATVIPHPHMVPLDRVGNRRTRSSVFVVGVHAKNLRANLDPLAVMDTIVDVVNELPNSIVRLDIDDDVVGSNGRPDAGATGAALRRYSARGVDVRIHPRFDDDELWQYLTEIDASVLPYRFGTHSGWLEACHDVGTAVVAPNCGYFADQKHCHTYDFGVGRFDPSTLRLALHDAYSSRPAAPSVDRAERETERRTVARMHEAVYTRAMARRAATVGGIR
ncbi:glycosyltransferase [Rhodococcoides yunnanense]|uniref:glycosyltransferase n=1 Tax=Rhodococcoides yunnanense TaxID=278209 RepID=UPI000A8142B6|nr:glycosyltransferase [Rhodococcus yunnanensis]